MEKISRVLILVLMEDALVQLVVFDQEVIDRYVLILFLFEDALVR